MTLEGIWNVEWPNVNAQRNYPFSQDATLEDGEFRIPNDLLVDFVLPVNVAVSPAIDPTLFHLSQLGIFSGGIVLTFAYNGEAFATVNVPTSGFVDYSTYFIQGTGNFFDSRGWLTIGSLGNALRNPGAFNFTVSTGRLHPMVIRPNLRTLSSMTVINGDDVSSPLSGDVALVAGSNFRFRVDLTGVVPQIIFDAIDGSDFEETCVCTDLDEDAPCIKTINGVAPNEAGEMLFVGSSCITINPGTNELEFVDECSTPCCDCRELQIVTNTLDSMLQQMQTLEMMGEKLDEVLTNTRVNLYASKTTGLPL